MERMQERERGGAREGAMRKKQKNCQRKDKREENRKLFCKLHQRNSHEWKETAECININQRQREKCA